MELPVQSASQGPRERNYERAPWCYLLWGIPIVMAIAANEAFLYNLIPFFVTEILWVASIAWIGTGCLINGRSCGRVHCRIDGIAFPILSIVGVLNIFSIISLSWSLFWLAAFAILVASFIPEWTWKKYS